MFTRTQSLVLAGSLMGSMLVAAPGSAAQQETQEPTIATATASAFYSAPVSLPNGFPRVYDSLNLERVSATDVGIVNHMLTLEGMEPIASNARWIGTTSAGHLIAMDAAGVVVKSPQVRGAQLFEIAPHDAKDVYQTAGFGSWLKGAARAFARAIVGCVGGVIGYDTILGILERRVSYWAFTRWLAGRVGWGLAISCAAGAATAVLGW